MVHPIIASPTSNSTVMESTMKFPNTQQPSIFTASHNNKNPSEVVEVLQDVLRDGLAQPEVGHVLDWSDASDDHLVVVALVEGVMSPSQITIRSHQQNSVVHSGHPDFIHAPGSTNHNNNDTSTQRPRSTESKWWANANGTSVNGNQMERPMSSSRERSSTPASVTPPVAVEVPTPEPPFALSFGVVVQAHSNIPIGFHRAKCATTIP